MSSDDMDALRADVLTGRDLAVLTKPLAPCPFDQGTAVLRPYLMQHYIACTKCGATGPTCGSPDEAAEKWNWRHG